MRGRGAAVVGVGLAAAAVAAVVATVLPWVQAAPPPADCGWRCYVPLERSGDGFRSFAGESGWSVDAARQAVGVAVALLAVAVAVLVARGGRHAPSTAAPATPGVLLLAAPVGLLLIAVVDGAAAVRFVATAVDGDQGVRLGDRFALPQTGPGPWTAAAAAAAAAVLALTVLLDAARAARRRPRLRP